MAAEWMLILDDDGMSRELLMALLQGRGYRVEAAATGEHALLLLENAVEPPVLVLTDLQMAGISGEMLAERLRACLGPRTVLMGMSGSSPSGEALRHLDGFISKPFALDEMLTAVARVRISRRGGAWRGMVEKEDARQEKSPALDEEVYRKLTDVMPASQLHEMYALCLKDGGKRLIKMREFVLVANEAEYLKEAHALKGGYGMLGATELYELAVEAERVGLRSGTPGHVVEQMEAASLRLERILSERS